MSIVVKNWKPAESCKSCKQAKKIMDNHMIISGQNHSIAIKRIRELSKEVIRLEAELCSLKKEKGADE